MKAFFAVLSLFSLCVVKAGISVTPQLFDHDDAWARDGVSQLKFSPFYADFVRNKASDDNVIAWVIFKDKDLTSARVISPEVCRKRVREGGDCIPQPRDYPVKQEYVQAVLKIIGGASKLRTVSDVLNGISVTAAVKDLDVVATQTFVNEVDVVQIYKQDKLAAKSAGHQKRHVDPSTVTLANGTISIGYGSSYASVAAINALPLHQEGYFGTGVSMLVVDTGFYLGHEVFSNMTLAFNGTINYWQPGEPVTPPFDTSSTPPERSTYGGPVPENHTQYDHGTAILSLTGGFKNGTFVGIAFNSTYYLAKTELIPAEGETVDQHASEDYFVQAVQYGMTRSVDIISASLGYPTLYDRAKVNGQTGKSTMAVNAAAQDGILVVVAVGNLGVQGVGPPADSPNALSVGAADGTGAVADFSSIGPTVDGRIKPEVSALGVQNYVAMSTPTSQLNPYSNLDGTSLSTPLVAGAAALIMEKNPTWTVQQVRYALMATASLASAPTNRLGWGLIDAFAASNYNFTALGVCPLNCSLHGTVGGSCNETAPQPQCLCDSSRYGFACQMSYLTCGDYCTKDQGYCEASLCTCYEHFTGIDCSAEVPFVVSAYTNLLEIIIALCISIVIMGALVAVIFLTAPNSKWKNVRIIAFLATAIGVPLLDIALSLGIFKLRYGFTLKNVWFVIDFVWKLLTAVLVFPKVAGSMPIIVITITGSLLHVAFSVPVAYYEYLRDNYPSQFLGYDATLTALQITQVVVLTLVDFVGLPYSFFYLKNRGASPQVTPVEMIRPKKAEKEEVARLPLNAADPEEGITAPSTPVPGAKPKPGPALDTKPDVEKADKPKGPVQATTYIHLVTHFCIAAYITYGICRVVLFEHGENSSQYSAVLLALFIPIGVVFWLDSKKHLIRSSKYFYHYLFLVGSFALIPATVVAEVYAAMSNYSEYRIFLSIIQSILMNIITLLTKRAARNMTSKVMFAPFIFRYQFFEDFLANILVIRRPIDDFTFWITLAYQAGWTVLRNTGSMQIVIDKVRNFVGRFIPKLKTDQTPPPDLKQSRHLLGVQVIAQQYAICETVVLIAIPAQFYVYLSFDETYADNIEVEAQFVWLRYFISLIVKVGCHLVVWLIIRRRAQVLNERKQVNIPGYWTEFAGLMKLYGAYFTIISFVSTRDAYIAVNAIFQSST